MISRIATLEDFDQYYQLRLDETNIYWTGYLLAPSKEKLLEWYNININKDDRYFFLFFEDNVHKEIVGYLYIDIIKEKPIDVEVGYGVYSKKAGKGYGTKMNKFAVDFVKEKLPEIKEMAAWIAQDNTASIKCVEKTGYHKTDKTKIVEFAGGEKKTFYKYILDL